MKITEIKESLGIHRLQFVEAENANGESTEWVRHWDNEKRLAVSMHMDTAKQIKANPEIDGLFTQTEIREGEQGEYTAVRVCLSTKEILFSW